MTGPLTLVTTSWDDGHVLDARLAEMLAARGLRATFYIAPENIEFPASQLISPSGLRDLAERFEIGGHTLRHRRLTTLTLDEADAEIRDGKARVEELVSRPVTSFCYPGGRYRPEHAALAKQAGFSLRENGAPALDGPGHRPLRDAHNGPGPPARS